MDLDRAREGRDAAVATGDDIWKDGAVLAQRLGPARASRIAPLRALLEAGIHVARSTDNVPPSLLHAIHHAVTLEGRGAAEPVGAALSVARSRVLDEAAEGVDELHFLDGLAARLQQAGGTDQDREALGAGDGHIQAVAGEEER
jgi:predicted amidohydrolase YtcJ